ncbi:MAG: MinD/ParA family protein [bacterium]|nr:MinD/ParA family protein [bacterium]
MSDQAERLRELAEKNNSNSPCKVIAITSGKGGVGKTNLAANLAISFSKIRKKVLVMDADLGLANVNVILGLIPPPRYNLYHVITGQKTLSEIVSEGPGEIKLVAGASGVREVANLSEDTRKEFISHLNDLQDSNDLILIDTGAGLSQNVLSFVLASDQVILITTPEPTSIANAYGVIKVISQEDQDTNIKLIVNRVKNILEGKRVADRIINIAAQFLNMRVETLGYILEDPLVGKAVRMQKPFILNFPNSKATLCINHIRDRLININAEPQKEKRFSLFFENLFRRRL